jgi:hypothetical protein
VTVNTESTDERNERQPLGTTGRDIRQPQVPFEQILFLTLVVSGERSKTSHSEKRRDKGVNMTTI